VGVRRAACAALCCTLLLLGACGGREEAESYTARGRVARVVDGGRSLAVDHETIPGYMDAMRMTVPVQDATQARDLQPGDKITFQLFVSGGRAVIGSIEKLPDDTELDLAESD
jgi:Cu/Ag efflux protein CusF